MSTIVDTAGIEVGDPEPWPELAADFEPMCLTGDKGYVCTAPTGHTGQHVASDGETVLHVWVRA